LTEREVTNYTCGDMLFENTTLTDTLVCSDTHALILKQQEITLDCLADINGTGSYIGVLVDNSNNVSIKSCQAYDFEQGIYINNSDDFYLNANELLNNTIGVNVSLGSTSGLAYYNYFDNDADNNAYDPAANNNDWNSTDIGNMWSDFSGGSNDYNVSAYGGVQISGVSPPQADNIDYHPHNITDWNNIYECGMILTSSHSGRTITLPHDLNCTGEDGIIKSISTMLIILSLTAMTTQSEEMVLEQEYLFRES
jgi:parallel beta-helix repeat protein